MNVTLKNSSEQTIFPVFWDDNYVSLLPGESRSLRCTIPAGHVPGNGAVLTLTGWNINEQLIHLAL